MRRAARLARLVLAAGFAGLFLLGLALAGARPGDDPASTQQSADALAREAGAAAQQQLETVPPERDTPRATVEGFLHEARRQDWARAALHLDFQALERERRRAGSEALSAEERAELARKLDAVLARGLRLEPAVLSDAPEGDPADHPSPNLERLGRFERDGSPAFEFLLARVRENGRPVWLFSESTVAALPELYAQRGYGWVEQVLPEYFFEVRLLSLELWQWLGLLVLVVSASLLGFLVASLTHRLLGRVLRAREGDWRSALLRAVGGPLRFAIAVWIFYGGTHFLHLPPAAADFFAVATRVAVLLAVAWVLLRSIDIVEELVAWRLSVRSLTSAQTLVPLGRRLTKVLVVAITGISLVQELGFSVTGILTTLGIGGLAVALAAQKPLEHFFGAIAVIVDQPVRVGDFCRVGEHLGTVEDIGLRSTRLRTLDRTLLAIPNAEFASARIENFSKRDRIRLITTLQLTYGTRPDQMRWILVELRRLLHAHPRIHSEPLRARFVRFGSHSLDIEVLCYVRTADHGEFLAVQEDVLLRIMDLVESAGASFAFPTQTLHLARAEPGDEERVRVAESKLQALREQGALPFPDLTPEAVARIEDSLQYPPSGSVAPGPLPR